MAIFHLSAKVISRGKGQSAIAAAAYRSGERLRDEATGEIKSYRARSARIVFAGIFAPVDAPAWARNRNQLWNQVERIERRSDATLAREIELALPHELTDLQRLWLVQDFVRQAFTRRGFVVDVAIHAPDGKADARNHHAHLLIAERRIGLTGFEGGKDRSLARKATLRSWRAQWAHLTNRHLERHGHATRVDHRSLAAQGVAREPTRHLGHVATQMERRGVASRRGEALRGVELRNRRRELTGASAGAAREIAATSGGTTKGAFVVFASPGIRPAGSGGVSSVQGRAPVEQPVGKCAVIRCSATPPDMPANDPGSASEDPGRCEAECAAIRAMFAARIEGLCRSLPPELVSAAVHLAMEEQRAVLHGIRERHKREAAGRRNAERRSRDRQRKLREARLS